MSETSKYFHDRLILALVSANAFLALLTSILIIIRLTAIHSTYYVQYRQNLGLAGITPGHRSDFISFMVFAVAVAIFHTVLSRRVYHINHRFSVVVLGFGTLLIVLAAIVSNALLGLA